MPGLDRARIVVTGAAGFIGLHLVDALVQRHSAHVIGVDNERSGDWSRLRVPVEQIRRDITDLSASDWADICNGASVVFHLAAEKYNSPNSSAERVMATNIDATHRLIEGAAVAGVERFVFTSSLYAYGSLGPAPMAERDVTAPTTMYGMSKVAGENLLRVAHRNHGLPWSVARLFFIFGPHQFAHGGYKSVIVSNFERLLSGQAPTIYGDGEQSLDYVYVDDCIDALERIATHPGAIAKVLNVASGHAVSINDLTREMLAVSGVTTEPDYGAADWTAGSSRCGDPESMATVTGWRATTPRTEGLARVWEWMKARG